VQAVHLCPAGHSGRHPGPVAVSVDVAPEPLGEMRSLRSRPNQRHLAAQDVHKLRQLVQVGDAQPASQPRAVPRGHGPRGVRIVVTGQGAQLPDHRTPVLADNPDLTEQRRLTGLQPDRDGQQRQQGKRDHQRGDRDEQVETPLQAPGGRRAGRSGAWAPGWQFRDNRPSLCSGGRPGPALDRQPGACSGSRPSLTCGNQFVPLGRSTLAAPVPHGTLAVAGSDHRPAAAVALRMPPALLASRAATAVAACREP